MRELSFDGWPDAPLRILCLGAHSDDLEIGCAGTVMQWLRAGPCEVDWIVFAADGERLREARSSAASLLRPAKKSRIEICGYRDGYFPASYSQLKDKFEKLKATAKPHVVLTHWLQDRHQDHRIVAELTWNTFRNNLILEYEIPKYEGDLGSPGIFVPIRKATAQRKVAHLIRHFGSQRSRYWFNTETFLSLARIRGLECRAESGFAEAFHGRKLVLRS